MIGRPSPMTRSPPWKQRKGFRPWSEPIWGKGANLLAVILLLLSANSSSSDWTTALGIPGKVQYMKIVGILWHGWHFKRVHIIGLRRLMHTTNSPTTRTRRWQITRCRFFSSVMLMAKTGSFSDAKVENEW